MQQDDDVLQQQLKEWHDHMAYLTEFYKRQCGRRMGVRLCQQVQTRQEAWEKVQHILYLVRLWTSQKLIVLAHWLDPTSSSQEAGGQEEDSVIDSTCRPVEPKQRRGRPRRRHKSHPTVYTVVIGEEHESHGLG